MGVAIIGAVSSIINNILNYKIKMAQIRAETKIDRNTEITVEAREAAQNTQKAVNGSLDQMVEDKVHAEVIKMESGIHEPKKDKVSTNR